MGKLQSVFDSLSEHISKPKMGRRRPSGLTMVDSIHGSGSKESKIPSLWNSFMGTKGSSGGRSSSGGNIAPVVHQEPLIKGLYMYGGVGCGKTVRSDLMAYAHKSKNTSGLSSWLVPQMLMDVFVHTAPPEFKVLRTQ